MDESGWLLGTDPHMMLELLGDSVSDRKQWLAACACCRRIPGFLESEAGRKCVEVVEEFADGQAPEEELAGLEDDERWDIRWYRNWPGSSLDRAIGCYVDSRWDLLRPGATPEEQAEALGRANAEATALLRDVFGNPLRRVAVDPAWLSATVVSLAEAAYEERIRPEGELDPVRLALLADALEEAGCADTNILTHLRGPGPHVRGCWVVDLILGKS
jgi:hypothetical protein